MAAAKTFEPEAIERVRDAGVREVGENYVKELRTKRDRVDGIVWHFIGTLQSHSAHHVAELADVVETVTPGRATERLARRALDIGRSIPVLIEVDFTGERTGVAPDGVEAAADEVAGTDGVDLVGLMTLPPMPSVAEDSSVLPPPAGASGRGGGAPSRCGGALHGNVARLPGCGGGRRYDGPDRHGLVRGTAPGDTGRT